MEKEEKIITEEKTEKVEAVPVAHVETKAGWMPKRTFLLIVLLVIITACLLGLALIQNVKSPSPVAKLNQHLPLTYATSELSFSTPVVLTTSGNYATDVEKESS